MQYVTLNTIIIISILSFLISLTITGCVRHYAIKSSLLDIPNERSSHVQATPRGGGLSIVLVTLCSTWLIWVYGLISTSTMLALFIAGGVVAIVGWFDDHGHVEAKWRLLFHLMASVFALLQLNNSLSIDVLGFQFRLVWFGFIIATLYLIWMLNLYNFMDGIDGLAGVEAMTVCLAIFIIMVSLSIPGSLILLPLVFSVCGFLVWNFPRAKIFMGDAGSGFLGITLGILSLVSIEHSPSLFWCWLIVLGVFIVDSTYTLLRRIARRERVFEAHRSHAYQNVSRILKSHTKTTLYIALINVLWLFPVAMFVAKGHVDGVVGVFIAYLPLVVMAIIFRAGAKEIKSAERNFN